MARTRARHRLSDFPPEVRREILEFRDRYGQTIRPPEAQTRARGPSGGAGPAEPAQHVMPRDEGWAVVREGADRATRVLETKAEAVEVAREIAKNQGSQLVVHRQDGTVQETRDYSSSS